MTEETPNDPTDTTATSADALRAMANPTRMRILGTLRVDGDQTVGVIGERLGEAPGAISYHLGQLSKAGLVERVESPDGDRRKSWWRARQDAVRFSGRDGGNADAESVDQFRRSAALSYEMAYERYLDRVPELPDEWVDACTGDDHVLRLTAEETRLMVGEINDVIRRWDAAASGRDGSGDGRESVAVTLQVFRWTP